MVKVLHNKQDITIRSSRVPYSSPLPPRPVVNWIAFLEELEEIKRRLLELEKGEKVIVIGDITREQAKKEIQRLFSSGRTLYYSDIVKELGIDLETVVDVCDELEKEKEIGVDASIS